MKLRLFALLLLSSLAVQAEVTMVSGTVYDTGKGHFSNDPAWTDGNDRSKDSNLCWAASSANLIQHWQDTYGAASNAPDGYADNAYGYPSGTCYLEVYELFRDSFQDASGNLGLAAGWYFNGSTGNGGQLISLNNGVKTVAYYKGKGVSSVYKGFGSDFSNLTGFQSVLSAAFSKKGVAVSMNVEGVRADGRAVGHAVTCWGYETDASGRLVALYIADSDDVMFGPRRFSVWEENGVIRLADEYRDGNYADGGTYKIGGLSYLTYTGASTKAGNDKLQAGTTKVTTALDASGVEFSSQTGLSVAAGGILASSCDAAGSKTTLLKLGVDSGTAPGNGLTTVAGSLVSLGYADVSISRFKGHGMAVGGSAYINNGNFSVIGNAGTGVVVQGTDADPKAYLGVEHNGQVVFDSNKSGALAVHGGAIPVLGSQSYYPSSGHAAMSHNTSVRFEKNGNDSSGGAIWSQGVLTITDNTEVAFTGNTSGTDGGAISMVSGMDNSFYIKGEGSISSNTGLSFSGNTAKASGGAIYTVTTLRVDGNTTVGISGNSAANGAAIYAGGAIEAAGSGRYFTSTASFSLSGNGSVSISGNEASAGDVIFNQGNFVISGNTKEVTFSGNDACTKTSGADGYVMHNGSLRLDIPGTGYYMALAVPVMEISHNTSVVFSGNTAQYDIFNEGKLYLCADAGHSITFQYGFMNGAGDYANAAENIKTYIGTDASGKSGAGRYIFADAGASVTMETSGTSIAAAGGMILSQGSLSVSGATMNETGFTLDSASLTLSDSSVSGALKVSFGGFTQKNTLTMTNVTVESGTSLVLTIDLSGGGVEADSKVVLGDYFASGTDFSNFSSISFVLENELDAGGLLVVDATGFLGKSDIKATAYGNQTQNGNLLTFRNVNTPSSMEWNCTGDGVWDHSTENWKATNGTYVFHNGVNVSFKGAGTVTLDGNLAPGSVVVDSAKDYTFAGNGELVGAMSLTKRGTGTLTITNTNSYTGDTHVVAGTLSVSGSITHSHIIVESGATLSVPGYVGGDIAVNGGSISGDLSTAEGSSFTTNGVVSVSGGLTLCGTWVCAADSVLRVDGVLTVAGSAVLDFSAFDISDTPYTIASVGGLAGSPDSFVFARAKGRQYELSLSGSDLLLQVSEQTTLLKWQGAKGVWQDGGTTQWVLADGDADDNLFHNDSSVVFDTKATVTITGDVAPADISVQVMGKDALTFSGKGSIVGEASLTMDGTGSLKLNATNSYSGGTIINAGTVTATGVDSFGKGGITLKDGTLNLGGKAVANDISATGGIISGAGKYAGRLTVGSGKVEVKGTAQAKAITISGGATLTGGTIKDTRVTLSGGTLASALSGKGSLSVQKDSVVNASLSQTGVTEVQRGATLTFGQPKVKTNITVAAKGVISGDGSVSMVGAGTLKLSAANTYMGGTTVNAGTVTATGVDSFGKGGITLKDGTLNLGGKAVANDISATGGIISGASKYVGHLSVDFGKVEVKSTAQAGSLSVSDGATLTGGTIKDTAIYLAGGTVSSAISGKSSVTVSGAANLSGKLSYTGGTVLASGGDLTLGAALGKSSITFDGGTLHAYQGPKDTVGKLTLASGQTLAVTANGGTLEGTLTLAGGTWESGTEGCLAISGQLAVTKASALDVSAFASDAANCKELTIATYDSFTTTKPGLLSVGAWATGGRREFTLDLGKTEATLTVSGETADLVWTDGSGKWELGGNATKTKKYLWTNADSAQGEFFYHGDRVTILGKSTLTLTQKIAPGAVTVSSDKAVTFSGKGGIAGSATLTMDGTGTLKMNATNTYTGGTLIKNGKVIATGADSFGVSDIVLSGGTLDFGGKAIANHITVDGNATILNGKAFAGTVRLDGGTLHVNANLTGTLVLAGGTLDLSGLAPKALAKLQFGTVVTQEETLTTINVGNLALGTYTVMNIKDASGLDTTLLQTSGLYGSFELQGTKLVLTVSDKPVAAAAEPEAVTAEEPQAAVEVEEALVTDNPAATSAAASPLAAYALSNPRVDGIIYTTQASAQIDGNRAAMDTVRDLMGGARMVVGDRGYRFALQATSANSRVKNDAKGMPGYNRNSIGGLLMVEKGFNDHMVAGLTLGHEHTDVRVRGLNSWRSNDTRLGAHLLAGGSSWRGSSYVGFGLHDYDMKRESATGTYTSKPTGYSLNMMEELAAVVNVGETSVVEPFLRVESSLNGINGTHERGGDADGALGIAHQNAWATTFTLGARYAQELRFGGAMRPARLALEAGVSKSVGDEGAQVDVYSWNDRSDRTTLSPAKRDRWGAKLGGSLVLPISDAETVNLGASVHLRGTGTEVNANVGYSLAF